MGEAHSSSAFCAVSYAHHFYFHHIGKGWSHSRVLVAHTCHPSYSRGRDQEDPGLKPAWANSSQHPLSKKTYHKKRTGGVVQGVGPEFKPQYQNK
jgi:hypothetical protein